MVGAVTTTIVGGYIVLTQDLSHGVEHDDEHHDEKHEEGEGEAPAEEDSKDEGMTKTEKANKEQKDDSPAVTDTARYSTNAVCRLRLTGCSLQPRRPRRARTRRLESRRAYPTRTAAIRLPLPTTQTRAQRERVMQRPPSSKAQSIPTDRRHRQILKTGGVKSNENRNKQQTVRIALLYHFQSMLHSSNRSLRLPCVLCLAYNPPTTESSRILQTCIPRDLPALSPLQPSSRTGSLLVSCAPASPCGTRRNNPAA